MHMASVLLLIAQEGYQDKELAGTRSGLEAAGFTITLCSKEAGACSGKLGGNEEATVAMRDVEVGDYDRIAVIGGPGAQSFKDDPEAVKLVQSFFNADKIVGAICIAPTLLAAAGLLDGKHATVWDSEGEQQTYLEEHGAEYTGDPVVIDGSIITANGPAAAEEFGSQLAKMSSK